MELAAAAQVRFLSAVAGEVSDMYRQKQEVEKSDASDKDKAAGSKAMQALINAAQKEALVKVKDLGKAVDSLDQTAQMRACAGRGTTPR